MKKIKYICLLLAAITFSSCEKLLEEDPQYSINNKTAFESEATANVALDGCYGYLTTYNVFGQAVPELFVGASGLSWAQTNKGDQDMMASFNMPATSGLINMAWSGLYKVIGQCNFFINSTNESSLSEAYKKNAIAQAKFLRALSYYYLASAFGDVPLRIDPTTAETITAGRTPRAEVYAQVEKDLLEAAEDLSTKEDLGAEAAGRATKYAAYAYLAKLYFMLASHENNQASPYWAKAKEMGDKVISEGKYNLEPKFKNLFVAYSRGSAESIFQLNFTTASTTVGNRNSWIFSPPNSTTGISWGRFRASKAFYDHFRGTHPDDPRLKSTFGNEWKQLNNNQTQFSYPYIRSANLGTPAAPVFRAIDSVNYSALADPTNPQLSEISEGMRAAFVNRVGDHQGWPYYIKQMDVAATAQNSNRNYILFRYADFLLMMADIENELGNKPEAIEYLNTVLARARNSGNTLAVHPKDATAALSPEELRVTIFNERLFELAGEFETFLEVRRRGVDYLKRVVDRHNNHNITRAFVENAAAVGNVNNFRERLLPTSPDQLRKNLLLPIPSNEINTNDQINEDDQNF